MTKTLETLSVRISTDLSSAVKGFDKLTRSAKRLGKEMASVGKSMSTAFTLPILAAGGATVKLASDAEEMQGKFNAVFQETAQDVEAWSRKFGKAIGRSRFDLMEMASSVQDTFVPLGFARDQAASMSTALTALAVDVASFNNASEPETMNLFTSALVGNHEAVRRFGIVITEATLKQELARIGADKLTGAALEQAKVQARLNLIMASTSDAHGDAERTSGSFANQMKALQANLKDVSIEMGTVLMPYARQLVSWAKEAIEKFRSLSPKMKAIIVVTAGIAAAMGPALIALGFMTTGLGALATGFTLLSKVALVASTGVIKAVVSMAAAVLTPVGAVVALLTGLGAAFYLFRDTVKEAVVGSWKVIKLYFADKFNQLSAGFESAIYDLGRAWERFQSIFTDSVTVRPEKTFADFIKTDLSGDIDAAVSETSARTKAAFEAEMSGIVSKVKSLKEKGSTALDGVGLDSKNAEALLSKFEGLQQSFKSVSGSGGANLIDEVENSAKDTGQAIRNEFTRLSVDIRRPIKSISDSLENGLFSAVNNVISNIVSDISGSLFSGVGGLLGFAGGGRVNAPSLVNERGMETLSSGKGLFVPLGGPATVRNAANSKGGSGGVVLQQTVNFSTIPEPTLDAWADRRLPDVARAAAMMVMNMQARGV